MKVDAKDFFMIVLLSAVFITSLFLVLKPTQLLSMASEGEAQQGK